MNTMLEDKKAFTIGLMQRDHNDLLKARDMINEITAGFLLDKEHDKYCHARHRAAWYLAETLEKISKDIAKLESMLDHSGA